MKALPQHLIRKKCSRCGRTEVVKRELYKSPWYCSRCRKLKK